MSENTLATLRGVLVVAERHLRQYREYAEAMRELGRGFTPSDPFSPEYLDGMIRAALEPKPPAHRCDDPAAYHFAHD